MLTQLINVFIEPILPAAICWYYSGRPDIDPLLQAAIEALLLDLEENTGYRSNR